MSSERRRVGRQNWIRLESQVFVKRTIFKKEWIPVVPFDYSRYGMGIQTDEVYHLCDEVSLSIKLQTDKQEIVISMIKGIVRYKEKHHSRFNYGVEFCFSSEDEKLLLEDNLNGIEETLRLFEDDKNASSSDLHSGA